MTRQNAAGGRTPLAAYRLCAGMLAAERSAPPAGLHLTFSDERMVPDDAPESNYGAVRPLLAGHMGGASSAPARRNAIRPCRRAST